MNIDHRYLLNLSAGIIKERSNFLSEGDVRCLLDQQRFADAIKALWGFTGHFYLWPKVLLARHNLPEPLKSVLKHNLHDELGRNGTLPHRLLFANMAHSLGITLDDQVSPNQFMRDVLFNAQNLSVAEAIGQFFANELMQKWGGFREVFKDNDNCDLTFVNVHSGSQHDNHSLELLTGIDVESIPVFLKGVIDFSNMSSAFIDDIRAMAFSTTECKKRASSP